MKKALYILLGSFILATSACLVEPVYTEELIVKSPVVAPPTPPPTPAPDDLIGKLDFFTAPGVVVTEDGTELHAVDLNRSSFGDSKLIYETTGTTSTIIGVKFNYNKTKLALFLSNRKFIIFNLSTELAEASYHAHYATSAFIWHPNNETILTFHKTGGILHVEEFGTSTSVNKTDFFGDGSDGYDCTYLEMITANSSGVVTYGAIYEKGTTEVCRETNYNMLTEQRSLRQEVLLGCELTEMHYSTNGTYFMYQVFYGDFYYQKSGNNPVKFIDLTATTINPYNMDYQESSGIFMLTTSVNQSTSIQYLSSLSDKSLEEFGNKYPFKFKYFDFY